MTRFAAPPARRRRVSPQLVLMGVFAAALNLRAPLAALPPLVPSIERDLALDGAAVGLLTALPVLCMGVFAPFAQRLAHVIGREGAVSWALGALVAGSLLRLGGTTTVLLYAGTLVTGIGIAIGGTLLPGIVKEFFAERVGTVTGIYMLAMMGGATVAAAVSVPLADAVSSWPRSLAAWSGLALVGLLAWTPVVRRVNAHEDPDVDPAPAGGLPWRSAAAWTISGYLALQSTQFYSQLAWVAPYFTDRGNSPREAGVLLGVFAGAQILSGIGGPALADRLTDRRPLVGVAVLANAVGLAGMLAAPVAGPVWVGLTGLGNGAGFALALVYLADWAGSPAAAARLSAMGFLVGYTVASLGPTGFGALRDASGGFGVPLGVLLVLAVVQLGVVVLMRPGRRAA